MAEISIPGYAVLLNAEEYVPTGTEKTTFTENLNELGDRVARKSTHTIYLGEDSSPDYMFQPMTVAYNDITYGTETWVMTRTNNEETFVQEEYGFPTVWSADGKRMVMAMRAYTTAYTHASGTPWIAVRADGSKVRSLHDAAARTNRRMDHIPWSAIEPDTFFVPGKDFNSEAADLGISTQQVYKCVLTDTATTNTQWIDLGSASGYWCPHKANSPDGRLMIVDVDGKIDPVNVCQVYPTGSLLATWNMASSNRNWPSNWGEGAWPSTGDGGRHNQALKGNYNTGYWWFVRDDGGDSWYRVSPTGSAADGGPVHVNDITSPYDWFPDGEIQPLNTVHGTGDDPWCDDGDPATDCCTYWSHPNFYADGQVMMFSNVDYSPISPGFWDIETATYITEGHANNWNVQHNNWNAFSDYGVAWSTSATRLWISHYNASTEVMLNNTYEPGTYDDSGANQSPDGTKVAWGTTFLNPGSTIDNQDVFVSVAYYPYPPEVTQCTATGGIVTTRFDWRLDQANPRTYTSRGWPDSDVDDPPPPRETELFRLWRSANGTTWTPIDTENANIFTKFDFPTGNAWSGGQTSYWEITDTPGDGTWYYAVTAKEWSGLESRALSNAFQITVSSGIGTGLESGSHAYPTSPGDDDNFYNTFNSSMIRYYNIYASDDGSPSISQTFRIASIPANEFSDATCSWVDWLGLTNGNTQYRVTAVDTLGNESSAVFVTGQSSTHQQSPATTAGQYTITWSKMH